MAGLKKRGNAWFASYYVAGKQVVKTTGIPIVPAAIPPGKTKAAMMKQNEASARLIAQELEKAAYGQQVDAAMIKALAGERKGRQLLRGKQYMQGVKDYLNDWIKDRKYSSRVYEERFIDHFISFLGSAENMPLDMVTVNHAKEFMKMQLNRVSSKTVKLNLTCLRSAFQKAVDSRIIPFNPFHKVTPGKLESMDKHERRAFTMEEAKHLTDVLPGEWPDMVRVCLYTGGQRLGDIATLKWEQIDMKRGVIAMTSQKTHRKMEKPIIVPLMDVLKRRSECRINDCVFPVAASTHAKSNSVCHLSAQFTNLLKKHGFLHEKSNVAMNGRRRRQHELSFHCLRATAVTALRLAGVPADLCRVIVGHDSEEIERVYFRPDSEAIAEAMKHLSL